MNFPEEELETHLREAGGILSIAIPLLTSLVARPGPRAIEVVSAKLSQLGGKTWR